MRRQGVLQDAARGLVLALFVLSPLTLGRMADFEPLVLLLVASAATVLWLLGGGRLGPSRPAGFDYLLLSGAALCALVSIRSVYVYDSLLGLSLLYGGLLTFLLVRECFADARWRRRAWWCVVAGGVAAGLWGAREYMQNAVVMGDSSWRAFGPFYNPNCLGGYMALLIPIPIALALGAQTRGATETSSPAAASPDRRAAKSSKSKPPAAEDLAPPRYPEIAGATSVLVLGLGLLCTGSKGAMLSGLLGALLFATCGAPPGSVMRRRLRIGAMVAVGLCVLAALTFPPIRNRIVGAFSSQQHSGSFRVYTWQATLQMVAARPLTGFGPGTYAHAFPRYAKAGFTRQAHQTPLQFGVEYGVPAALMLLVGIGWAMAGALRGGSGLRHSDRLLAAAAVGGLLALWAHNLVDYTWYLAGINGVSWALLGLALAPGAEAERLEPRRRAARAVPMVLSAVLALWAVTALYSEAQRATGKRLGQMGAAESARDKLARVLPVDAYRWTELSRVSERESRGLPGEQLERAIAERRRAIALQPTEPTNYTALTRMLTTAGRLDEAQAAAEKAVECHPTSTDALAALGLLLERRGSRAAALDVYRRLAALYDTPVRTSQAVEYFIDRNYVFAWVPLAEDAMRAHKLPEALDAASKAADVAGQFVASTLQYRQMLELAGRYDPRELDEMGHYAERAAAVLRRVGTPIARLRAALGLVRVGRLEDAVEKLRALADGDQAPHSAAIEVSARFGLAECLEAQGDTEGARQLRDRAMPEAQQVLGELGANGSAGGEGWAPEDTRRLQAALERATQAQRRAESTGD